MLQQQKRISLGITGGIGSGKSYVCRQLERLGIPVFYTDIEARWEMSENFEIHEELRRLIGSDVMTADGTLVKSVLSAYISQSSEAAHRVDQIVHPRVRRRLRRWMKVRTENVLAVECALLFESYFDKEIDYSILVSASTELRITRVMERDGKSRDEVLRWMDLQMSEEEKQKRSDFLIINDGKQSVLEQINQIFAHIGINKLNLR